MSSEIQAPVCEVWRSPDRLRRDFDLETGAPAGLLCSDCLDIVAYAREVPQFLPNALRYLAVRGDRPTPAEIETLRHNLTVTP